MLGRSRLCVRDTPDLWRRWPTVPRLQMGYSLSAAVTVSKLFDSEECVNLNHRGQEVLCGKLNF